MLAVSFIKTLKLGDPLSLYVFTRSTMVYEKIFSSINCGHAVVNETLMNAGVEGMLETQELSLFFLNRFTIWWS